MKTPELSKRINWTLTQVGDAEEYIKTLRHQGIADQQLTLAVDTWLTLTEELYRLYALEDSEQAPEETAIDPVTAHQHLSTLLGTAIARGDVEQVKNLTIAIKHLTSSAVDLSKLPPATPGHTRSNSQQEE